MSRSHVGDEVVAVSVKGEEGSRFRGSFDEAGDVSALGRTRKVSALSQGETPEAVRDPLGLLLSRGD